MAIQETIKKYVIPDDMGMIKGDFELYKDYPFLYMSIKYVFNLLDKYMKEKSWKSIIVMKKLLRFCPN